MNIQLNQIENIIHVASSKFHYKENLINWYWKPLQMHVSYFQKICSKLINFKVSNSKGSY